MSTTSEQGASDPVSVVEKEDAGRNSRVLLGNVEIDGFATNASAHEYADRLRVALAPYMGKTDTLYGKTAQEWWEAAEDASTRTCAAILLKEDADKRIAGLEAELARLRSLVGQPAEVTDEDARVAKDVYEQLCPNGYIVQRHGIKAMLEFDRQRRPVMPRRPVTERRVRARRKWTDTAIRPGQTQAWRRDRDPDGRRRADTKETQFPSAPAKALNEAIGADTGIEHPTPAEMRGTRTEVG